MTHPTPIYVPTTALQPMFDHNRDRLVSRFLRFGRDSRVDFVKSSLDSSLPTANHLVLFLVLLFITF